MCAFSTRGPDDRPLVVDRPRAGRSPGRSTHPCPTSRSAQIRKVARVQHDRSTGTLICTFVVGVALNDY